MKYTIIGSGPTGLSLAYVLGLNGIKVDLIEQSNQLGGSWNSAWIENQYWTENSPRVILRDVYIDYFLKDIGIKESDFYDIYGGFFDLQEKFITFFYNFFHFSDYFKFLYIVIYYKLNTSNLTLQDVLDESTLSQTAKKAINIFSITINDIPSQTNINDFCGSISINTRGIKQFKDPNLWHVLVENKLKKLNNVNIYKNTQIIKILQKNNKIYAVENQDNQKFNCDKLFLCTQSNNILPLLENSDSIIQNNWLSIDYMRKWCNETFYIGFGFQLHFDTKVDFPEKWCQSCTSEWNIIILPVSDWLIIKSKNPKIKTVWSCTITSVDTKSKTTRKTVNESNLQEVLDESMNQLNKLISIPKPYKITSSQNLKKIDNKWLSYNTGFTRGKYDYLPIQGKIKNLYALGSFTDCNYNSVTIFETSIRATVQYLNNFESKNLIGFHKMKTPNYLLITIIIITIIFLYYKYIYHEL